MLLISLKNRKKFFIENAPIPYHPAQNHDKHSPLVGVFSSIFDENVQSRLKKQRDWGCSRHRIGLRRFKLVFRQAI